MPNLSLDFLQKHGIIYISLCIFTVKLQGGIFLSEKMDQRQKKFYDILVNGGSKDNVIVYEMMKYIPDDFSGKILEIPARRSKVVYNKLSKLKNADITCVDSDKEALAEAEKRFAEHKIANAKTIVGNIDNKLEFEDDTFDIVLSINGFDTFSNKNRAISQTLRVLKKGGMLIAGFYVEGNSKLTDWKVKHNLVSNGILKLPFYTAVSVQTTFSEIYEIKHFHERGSMVYFCAVKK